MDEHIQAARTEIKAFLNAVLKTPRWGCAADENSSAAFFTDAELIFLR